MKKALDSDNENSNHDLEEEKDILLDEVEPANDDFAASTLRSNRFNAQPKDDKIDQILMSNVGNKNTFGISRKNSNKVRKNWLHQHEQRIGRIGEHS